MPPLITILMWPLAVLMLFRRFDLPVALCCSIILGYLFLPEKVQLNLPLFPAIDKHFMPSVAALFMVLLLLRKNAADARHPGRAVEISMLPGWLPRHPITRILLLGLFASAFMTVLFNGDNLNYGGTRLPGIGQHEALSTLVKTLIEMLPLLLARKFLATEQGHRTLLKVFCIIGLIYSLLALYEIRMSPQLNVMVYGFFPHSWQQHIRGDGFRPLVFLKHGLWLGIFMSGAVLAAAASFRLAPAAHKTAFAVATLWLLVTLLLSKTFGALAITLLLLPVVLLLTVRLQLICAALIGGAILVYPALRGANLVPVQTVVELARSIDPNRASSLQYRLNNEDILLAKANERPLFGWGWGRNRAYDAETGRSISTTDGKWVILIGTEGWLGYLCRYGLMTVPIMLMALRKRKYEVTAATSMLALVLAGNLIDLIPNAGLTVVTWLMAGALLGRLEIQTATEPEVAKTQPLEQVVRRHRYSRGRAQPAKTPQTPRYSRAAPRAGTSKKSDT
ncbi:hypothetical protein KX928_23605 [Roseobacter sp. YSTF-M11]|uniref:Uncharacterized protein n=1 Tax=Roseobacter insulae TaxID=2859783 RepID=A0A9X1K4N6_9RHOB|nr:hypothetical protein [Roseobacter insulae]MBW4710788.1 hypothetical protein [Roseobacter insulae]